VTDRSDQGVLKIQQLAIPAVTIMVVTAFFYYARPILVPTVLGITLAFVLTPLVHLLKRFRIPHTAAVLIVVFFTLVIFLSTAALIGSQAGDLVSVLPVYWKSFQNQVSAWLERFPSLAQYLPGDLQEDKTNILKDIKWNDIASVSGYLFAGLGSALGMMWKLLVVLLITSFALIEQVGFREKLANLFGLEVSQASRKIIDQISDKVSGFLVVKTATSAGLGVVVTIGLIIMGVPYAYVWGPLAGVLNLIPYVGAFLGAIPPMIIASIEYGSLWWMLYIAIFFFIIQFLEGNIVTPKLVGDRINMNLTSVLIATLYWGWLWGGAGVILAMPITATLKVICDHVESLKPIGNLLDGNFKG